MRIDTMDSLRVFLSALAITKPAILIKLADSRDNMKDKLVRFTSAWIDKGEFPSLLYAASIGRS